MNNGRWLLVKELQNIDFHIFADNQPTTIRVLKNFAILTGKYLCWGLLLVNFQAFTPAIFLNRDPKTGVFL